MEVIMKKSTGRCLYDYRQGLVLVLAAILAIVGFAMNPVQAASKASVDQFPRIDATSLKKMISDGNEFAILDPREEGVFGKAHLLQAVNVPLSKLELTVVRLVPRKSTRIVLTDGGDGMSERAALKLKELGYTSIAILDGGYPKWQAAGNEIFSGMSVPGKAFGEWIAVTYDTPTITPEEVHKKISAGEDVLILDSRPANEYLNMNIPGSTNCPVSELVYRLPELPVKPETFIVVNCAGRTRSLIGTQTLINAGVKNKVAALRGGTMAWQMAGFDLEHGSTRHAPEPWGKNLEKSLQTAQKVADRFQVKTVDSKTLDRFKAESATRTLYIIDVRTPDEFRAGHRPDSEYGWGVQIVQGMDKYAATRNGRVVLVDNQMVRAFMTASWLVQAGWPDTFVLKEPFSGVRLETGAKPPKVPGLDKIKLPTIETALLSELIKQNKVTVVDFSDSLSYKKGHIPGAWFAIRSGLAESVKKLPESLPLVATGDNPVLVKLAAVDLASVSGKPVQLLAGGNAAWRKANLQLSKGFEKLASEPEDIFRMPFLWGHFEDKKEFEQAANDYFNWELQLPAQLERAAELHFGGASQK